MSHPTDEQLDALIRETLGPKEQTEILTHIDGCESCLERLASYHERQPNVFSESALGHVAKHPECRQSFVEETKAAATGMRATRLTASTEVSFSLNRGRSLGSGGFGQVFEYFDSCFQRPVAFKILQDRWIGHPEVVKRFLREMEITAAIDHPGCPTVYGSGRTDDGRDFFWMQLVSGSPLSDVISSAHGSKNLVLRRGNEQVRTLLSMFKQICDVIAVAHEKGIWHRDLKPANIHMHENHFPVVLDWGLATRQQDVDAVALPSDGTEITTELTRAGDQLGTLPYMSPEAARGEIRSVNHKTDIYSLGGILHAMLTGDAPHAELLRKNSNPKEALAEIGRGHQPPYECLPKELASICSKALSADSTARYKNARELAKDVDRWLAGEPVAAHSYGWTGRAMLAIGRRPVTFAASTLILAALVVLTTLGNQWRSEATQQRLVAEQRFSLALEAWTTLIDGVQENLGQAGGTAFIRQQLIDEASKGIEQLVQNAGKQPGAELVMIQASLELAHIQRKEKGEFEQARTAYLDLKEKLESLAETHRLPLRYKLFADATNGAYQCSLKLDGTDAAETYRIEFEKLKSEFLQQYPKEPAAVLMKSQSETQTGRREEDKGLDALPDALECFKAAEQSILSLPEEVRKRTVYQHEYLIALADQARVLNRMGKSDEAVSIQQRVVDEMEVLTQVEPTRKHQIGLVEDKMSLANMHKQSDPAMAVEMLVQVERSARQLKENYVDDNEVAALLRDVIENLATAYRSNGQPDKAIELLSAQYDLQIMSQLVAAPMDRLLDQAFVAGALGMAHQSNEKPVEAANSFRNAIEIRKAILNRDPGQTDNFRELMVVAQGWADNVEEQNAETVKYLQSLCQLTDKDGKASNYPAQLKRATAILFYWYGEHALAVANAEKLPSVAEESKVAYSRTKELLLQIDGVPPAMLAELESKIQNADELYNKLKSAEPQN